MKTFEVKSGKIHVSDACYEYGTWCAEWDIPVKNGTWTAERQAKHLVARLKDEKSITSWQELEADIGVDSGQVGIFCSSIYPKSKKEQGEYGDKTSFYGKCCDCSSDRPGIVEGGCVTGTNHGDGSYIASIQKNESGEIVAVKVSLE